MEREVDMKEVSDGKLYTSNDLVRADCGGCKGCSTCCRGMGTSVTLDPWDVYMLCRGLLVRFEELIERQIELAVADRLILPNLKMTKGEEACSFLDPNERCQIHAFRPGMCRLFPLGRYYEADSFRYFLQIHECPKESKAKIKVKKWLDISDLKTYETFIQTWHDYLKRLRGIIEQDPDQMKEISMEILKTYYLAPYDLSKDFYEQFYERLQSCRI